MSSVRPKIASSRIALLLFLVVCLFASLAGLRPVWAQNAADQAVLLSATASDPTKPGPLQITLNFPADGQASNYTIGRKLTTAGLSAPFTRIGTISAGAATATSYVDRLVSVGTAYEYQVVKSSNVTAYGYVVAGIHVPLPSIPANANADGSRGTVILIYANDTAADPRISAGLTRLTQDLVGDGWNVIPHSVNRDSGMNAAGVMNDHGDAVRAVKALIRADYTADPVNVKAVLLFGHVPVPYSGEIAPDGHNTHVGAWPADVYYGDMGPESYWTDTTVNDTTADNPRTYNVPGDGKFDESDIPTSTIALEVGRVDLADMPSFSNRAVNPESETDLLAQYLNKDHNYRSGFLNLNPVGRVTDHFGYFNGEAFAANGFRNFAPFFGAGGVTTTNGANNQIFPDLDLGNFEWTYGCGPGGPTGAGGVGSTSDFAANDPHSTFYMLFGSFFGDWGYGFSSPNVSGGGDDFLRAPLATTTYGLTDSWGGRPNWFYQHMGLGSEIGYSARLTQSNTGVYSPGGASEIHVALMGDPTLRLHVVTPASGLTAATSATDVLVSWVASNQALDTPIAGVNAQQPNVIAGYNVYRQDSATGPFTLLNTGGLVSGTTYTDAGAGAATHTYQVRAVALQDSPSGTYYNQSQGVFQAFDPAHAAPTLTLVSPTKAVVTGIGHPEADAASTAPGVAFYVNSAAGNPTVTLTIAAQATSSIPNDPGLTVTFYVGSVLLGTATAAPYQMPVTLTAGTYQISAIATDGQGATVASNELPVYVFKDGRTTSPTQDGDLVIFQNGALGKGWSDISNKTNNAMTDNLGANPGTVNLNLPGSALVLSHLPIDASLYPDLLLHLVMTGNTDPTKPGGQKLIISAPIQDVSKAIAVTLLGNNNYNDPPNEYVIPIGGLAGAGERTRSMDGLVIRDAANNTDPVTGKPVATPTFYIRSIYLTSDSLRGNRPAGVAIHLDQAKFAFASQATVPIVAKGDAATSDGSVVEVDLFLSSDGGTTFSYIGRGIGQGPSGMLYSPYSFTLPSLAPGSYTLMASAVTSFGTPSSSTAFTFVVVAPPTVAITAPANNSAAATNRPLTITATAVAGANGNLTNVQFFESFNGATPVEIGPDQTTGSSPYTVQFTPPSAGSYTLTVIATDDAGGTTTSAPVTINVGDPPTNVAITAPASGQTFATSTNVPVTATATAGSNPITQVQFFANGTLIGTATAAPYTVNFNTATPGTYALTAVATDGIGLTTTSAPVSVTISAPPTISITAPTDGTAFTAPATFTITAGASQGTNPITQVQFYANGTAIGAPVTAAPYTFNDANVPAGTYALTAVATDSAGLTATSQTVTVTVSTPPTVTITAPANNASFVAPATFTITASVTQGTNPITQVQFYANGTALGAPVTAAPYTFNDANVPAGTYALTAVVTDSLGLTATSAPVNVVVNTPPSVVITAPKDGTFFAAPATFSITATATAGSNPISQVQFYANGSPIGAPVTAAPYTVSFANVPVGTYALTAVVTDNVGLSATSPTVNVTVANAPTVAITAPADGATFVAPASFTVTASATAGSNPITKVDFFSNGALVGTATTAPYTISLSGLVGGTYTLTAVATDSVGLTATSAPINVVVNTPPAIAITVPVAGATATAPATFTITASATAGSHPITQVQFFANGVAVGTPVTAAPYSVSDANVPAGAYALTAVATDSIGLTTTSAPINVVVNAPPSVTLTAPTNGATATALATFTVTASATPGSSPITEVQFYANGKPIGAPVTAAPYTTSFAGVAAGTYALTAVAVDSAGLTATSQTVTVTVNSPPSVAITAPAGGTVFTSPATFNVTASATPGSSPIVKVDFFANGTLIGTATASPYTVSFANVAAGSYALTAVATDSAGLTATSATVTVTVNASPTVAITSPANGATFTAPTLIPITAAATAGSNPIAKVDFFANGQAIGTALSAPYRVNFNGATAGTYVLTARAADTAGQTTTSTPVTITVNAAPTVSITTPTNGASFAAPATFSITASATAGSSPITQVQFFAGTTLIGTATAAPYTVSFANVPAGSYVLTAVATDSTGLTATSAAVNVTVVAPQPVFGLVTRSTDSSAVLGATVTFTNQATGAVTTATTTGASSGPDGRPIDYVLTSLAPGTYTVAVSLPNAVAPAAQTVRITLGQAARVDFTFSPLHSFPTGLQMFSVPYDYSASGQSLSAILGIPSPRLVDWNPATTSYQVPTTFLLGMGYWANFPAGTGLILQGVPAATSHAFTKALAPGWNIIGDPFLTSAPWSSVQVTGANGTPVLLSAAAGQHLIGTNLYTYNQSSNAYNTLPVAGGSGSLDPYVGYWIYAVSAVTLTVAAPGH